MASTDFVLYHYYATNDLVNPIIGVPGWTTFNNIINAQAGAPNEIMDLSLGSVLGGGFNEFKAIGTVIFETNSAYANGIKSRVRINADGYDYIDWRFTRTR